MPKRGKGQPPKLYDEAQAQQVHAMSQYGVPQEDIAATIGMSVPTMLKLYDSEHRKGKALANAVVGKRLFEKCKDGDTTALIFWAKTQMHWRETQHVEVTGQNGGPLQHAALSPAERMKLLRKANKK